MKSHFILFTIGVLFGVVYGLGAQRYGYITVDQSKNANLFYWLVESSNDPATDPVVLWMSGGPGCSGGLAMFYENGPWSVSPDGSTLISNPFSWSNNATVIWIDQPPGAGFSYADSFYIHDEAGVAVEMKAFLLGFFNKYPEYSRQDFYLFGESYAGHYIPAVAEMIALEKARNPAFPVNLKGLGIGNGHVDPYNQAFAQGQFAYDNKLINETVLKQANAVAKQCQALIAARQWKKANEVCNENMMLILKAAPNTNPMKIDEHCAIHECFNYKNIASYLNQPSVKAKLGVPSELFWSACNYNETFYFTEEDLMSSFAPSLAVAMKLLPKMRVLIYYGDLDLVCPWNGGLDWMKALQWHGQKQFNELSLKPWQVDGAELGSYKTYDTVTFLKVAGGGHMAPHDVPQASLQLLNQFIFNIPF